MVRTPSSRVVPLWGPHLSTAVVEGSLVNASGTVVVVSAAAGASGCDEHEPNKIDLPQAQAYEAMAETMATNAVTCDAQEGMQAFVDKRKPEWRNK